MEPLPLPAPNPSYKLKEHREESREFSEGLQLVGEADQRLKELPDLSNTLNLWNESVNRDILNEEIEITKKHVRRMQEMLKFTTRERTGKSSEDPPTLKNYPTTKAPYSHLTPPAPSAQCSSLPKSPPLNLPEELLDTTECNKNQPQQKSSDHCKAAHSRASHDIHAGEKELWPSSFTDPEDTSAEDLEQLFQDLESDEKDLIKFDASQTRQKLPPNTTALQFQDKKWLANSTLAENTEPLTYADDMCAHQDFARFKLKNAGWFKLSESSKSTTTDFSSLLKRRRLDMGGSEGLPKESKQTTLKHKVPTSLYSRDSTDALFTPMSAVNSFFAAKSGLAVDKRYNDVSHTSLASTLLTQKPPSDVCPVKEQQAQAQIQVPLPRIPDTLPKVQCILSLTLITYRALLRRIHHLYPEAEFLERDFTEQASVALEKGRFSTAIKPNTVPAMWGESDIILSPTTGIVLTTVQKLHQRPLPGSNSPQALQARLAALAPKYEKIILLVSQSLSNECPPALLSPSDAIALAEITAFGQSAYFKSLGTSISIILSFGGEDQAARWLVALMAKHCLNPESCASFLGQDDTPWETWLRNSGLNAYAAQATLAVLKSSISRWSSSQESPLAALVRMSDSERVRVFSQLLGRSAVDRLNSSLEGSWRHIR